MKNIIIAGASRSGKSTLAKIIAKEFNMTYIPFDSIISTIENLYPETGIAHLDENIKMSKKLAIFLGEFIKHLEYENINYVIDLYQIYPQDLVGALDSSKCLPIYLGFPDLSAEEKLVDVRKFERENDWTKQTSNEDMKAILRLFIKENKAMYNECVQMNIKFFDTGKNFSEGINLAKSYIVSNF